MTDDTGLFLKTNQPDEIREPVGLKRGYKEFNIKFSQVNRTKTNQQQVTTSKTNYGGEPQQIYSITRDENGEVL